MRGINRQSIFEDEEDNWKFLQTLRRYKKISGFWIFAYCLMGNHVHLLLKEGLEPLEQVMRRLCGSYVYWYNRKYERIGNLFQDRFKSEPVEDDPFFITVLRYIHQNPCQAGLVKEIGHYRWSSYHEYLQPTSFVDIDFALNRFHTDREKAVEIYIAHQSAPKNDRCLELEEKHHFSDQEARAIIKKVCNIMNAPDLQRLERQSRNDCLKKLKEEYNLSVRQISRLTGIGRGVVFKA
jgi:REP element-mobilizing transposase RayT